jgi:hypothetical protein
LEKGETEGISTRLSFYYTTKKGGKTIKGGDSDGGGEGHIILFNVDMQMRKTHFLVFHPSFSESI